MTPEERHLLERAVALAEDNNAILRKMQRSSRLSLILRICYWGAILFLSFGAYYFIQPYINQMLSLMNAGSGDIHALQNISEILGK
jgi:hypothetical protein